MDDASYGDEVPAPGHGGRSTRLAWNPMRMGGKKSPCDSRLIENNHSETKADHSGGDRHSVVPT
jgi:hypothetical protein